MRCKACDVLLTDKEAAFKDPMTGHYLDLCSECNNVSQDTLMQAVEDYNTNQIDLLKKSLTRS